MGRDLWPSSTDIEPILACATRHDGSSSKAYFGLESGKVLQYDLLTQTSTLSSFHNRSISALACDSRTGKLYSGSRDRCIAVDSGMFVQDAHDLSVTGLCMGDNMLCSGSRDTSVKAWDLETGTCITHRQFPRNLVTCLNYSAMRKLVVQGSEDLCVRLWDMKQGAQSSPVTVLGGYVYFPVSLDVNENSEQVLTGCKGFDDTGSQVKLWDLRNPSRPLLTMEGHCRDVVGCAFVGSSHVASASCDGVFRLWKISSDTAKCVREENLSSSLTGLHKTGKGNKLLVTSFSGDVWKYDNLIDEE